MNGAVDVLAVMDETWRRAILDDYALEAYLKKARKAVAALIEADKEYDAAIAEAKDLNRRIAEQGWFEVEFDALRKSGERVVAAQIRRAAALNNVGPQS